MIIAVTGGRTEYLTQDRIKKLSKILFDLYMPTVEKSEVFKIRFHLGDARGIDREIYDYLIRSRPSLPWRVETEIKVFYAEWEQCGKKAGHLRNAQMLEGADLLIAFPGGPGTANCKKQARAKGIKIIEIGESN